MALLLPPSFTSLFSLLTFLRMKEYQWFLTWLSVRPGSLLAISDHLQYHVYKEQQHKQAPQSEHRLQAGPSLHVDSLLETSTLARSLTCCLVLCELQP